MWVNLTKDDLESAQTADEVFLLGQQVTDSAPVDRVPPILAQVTAEVRGYIASCEQNRSIPADDTLIPIGFKFHALAIARWRLLTTLPNYDPGEARKHEYNEAMKFFDKVASCKIRPQPPQAGVATLPINALAPATTTPHDAEVICDIPSRTGRQRMNGL